MCQLDARDRLEDVQLIEEDVGGQFFMMDG